MSKPTEWERGYWLGRQHGLEEGAMLAQAFARLPKNEPGEASAMLLRIHALLTQAAELQLLHTKRDQAGTAPALTPTGRPPATQRRH